MDHWNSLHTKFLCDAEHSDSPVLRCRQDGTLISGRKEASMQWSSLCVYCTSFPCLTLSRSCRGCGCYVHATPSLPAHCAPSPHHQDCPCTPQGTALRGTASPHQGGTVSQHSGTKGEDDEQVREGDAQLWHVPVPNALWPRELEGATNKTLCHR